MNEFELATYVGGPAGLLGPIGIPEVMWKDGLLELQGKVPSGTSSGYTRKQMGGRLQPFKTIVIMDLGLEGRSNLVAGANQIDYHYRNVTPGRDFTPTVIADVRSVNEGELDPIGGEPLHIAKAVEIGHIFKLGYKYSKSMGATVLNRDGKETTPIMGSYGIGIERILTAAIEQSAAKFAAQSAAQKSTDPQGRAERNGRLSRYRPRFVAFPGGG